jgi:hypothetical protein
MTERRPLKIGMASVPALDAEAVRRFVKSDEPPGTDAAQKEELSAVAGHLPANPLRPRQARTKPTGVTPVGLIPVTVRLRPELAGALKRASLERQLAGEIVFTQQQLVEEALEPWLRSQGYLA